MVDQTVFGGAARAAVAAAEVGQVMATIRRAMVGVNLAADVTAAYGGTLAADAGNRSALAVVEAVQADRDRAASRRDAGLVTDADVLQIDVYLARAREQQIRAAAGARIARAQLNQLMGEPLDAVFELETPAAAPSVDPGALAALETEALAQRPDVKLAALNEQLADSTRAAARAAFLPQVAVQGGWELNGSAWASREASWTVGVVARVNVFNGFADRARLAEAREQTARRSLEREKAVTAARLDVRIALARLEAARASEAVGRTAVEQARESQRIIRDRYDAGLTDVASLVGAAESVAQADAQQIAAQAAILIETAALERTLGRQ
jgi:outer membrane protein TolC